MKLLGMESLASVITAAGVITNSNPSYELSSYELTSYGLTSHKLTSY